MIIIKIILGILMKCVWKWKLVKIISMLQNMYENEKTTCIVNWNLYNKDYPFIVVIYKLNHIIYKKNLNKKQAI